MLMVSTETSRSLCLLFSAIIAVLVLGFGKVPLSIASTSPEKETILLGLGIH